MTYYRNGYRRPYRTNMTTTVSSGSGECTINQRNFVLSLVQQIETAQAHVSPDLIATAETVIGNLSVLPRLLHDSEWQNVTKGEVSSVIDALKALQNAFSLVAKAAQYPFLPPHDRVMTTRFDGQCAKCGMGTVAGTDLAVQIAGRWKAWCVRCATTDPTQAEAAEAAAKAALAARLGALAGLHLFGRKVYRIGADGTVEVRRGRRWYEVDGETAPFGEATRVTAEVASAYADEVGQCINCGLAIGEGDDRRSIAVGYGPVCADRWGWHFPTHDEADAIIERRRLARLAAVHQH